MGVKAPFPTPLMPVVEDRFDSCMKHSHDPSFDLRLVSRLVELMGVRARFSLTFAMSQRFCATTHEVELAVRLILKCLKMLHLCGYPQEDIEVMVAHASVYLRDLLEAMRQEGQPEMGISELAHVFCVLMYISHSFTNDQNCPLRCWHRHLFMRYCEFKTLNSAVMQILNQLEWGLRLRKHEMRRRLAFLQAEMDAEAAKIRNKMIADGSLRRAAA